MANKRKNKKKNAAAKQKAAAAYMSKKNAPVQKPQAPKAAPKPMPEEPVRVNPPVEAEAVKTESVKTEVVKTEAVKAEAVKAEPIKTDAGKAEPVKAEKVKNEAVKERPTAPKAAKPAPVKKQVRSGKPMPKPKPKQKPKRKKEPLKLKDLRWDRIIAVALVFCALVAGIVALIFWLSTRFSVPKAAIREYRGVNYSTNDLFEIQADAAEQSRLAGEMKRKGDVKLFEYYAADKLVIPDKGEPGWINLSNAFNNKYILMATIVDEAGNVCAHTRGIPAGFTLGEITLEYSVPYGTHNMHLVVSAYDIKTREVVGVQHSPLTVQVGIEEEMTDG